MVLGRLARQFWTEGAGTQYSVQKRRHSTRLQDAPPWLRDPEALGAGGAASEDPALDGDLAHLDGYLGPPPCSGTSTETS
ncbi:unnamed protein product [Prorocentrum cordatum]|uniref:Uncharacterized protein n=1 Tax=Prorocentrum cordatum TaxID=2364126 RepID=A0ABN9XZT7_9DINO|nr:unnamed protein product [Polarella glacialis]